MNDQAVRQVSGVDPCVHTLERDLSLVTLSRAAATQ